MRIVSWIGGAAAALAALAAPARTEEPELAERIAGLVRPLVEAELVTGLTVGVLEGDRRAAWGFGAGPGGPPDGRTIYEIGSVTKVFTGLLLADLARAGVVALEDPVAKHLPPTPGRPPEHPVTLVDLSTHTSGLPRLPRDFAPADAADPYADYGAERLEALCAEGLARPARARFAYSNLGAGLLGHALARAAGTSYEAAVVDRIGRPLGLLDTRIELADEQRRRLATGHDEAGSPVPPWKFDALSGAGALRSTADDLLAFLAAHLPGADTPLAESIAVAVEPRRETDRPGQRIALGWHVEPDGMLWHNGQTGGFHSFVAVDRERGLGVVVLASSASGAVDALGFQAMGVLRGEAPQPLPVRVPVKLSEAQLDRFVGSYRLAPGFVLTVERQGARLLARATGQDRWRVYPASETRFFYRVVDAELEFRLDAKGRVEGVVLHQDGAETFAPRE